MQLPNLWIRKLSTICGICVLMLLVASSVRAQIIWQEAFNYVDGTTIGANNNTANPAPDWTSQCATCVSGDWFEVRSNKMEGLDVNGPAILVTEWIDISAYPSGVEVLVDLEESGSLEGCPNGLSSGCNSIDWIRIEYSIDGGPFIDCTSPFGGPCSGNCAGDAYVTYGDFAAFTFSQCPLSGDSLRLRVSVQCWATSEQLIFDNITVQGQTCIASPPIDSLVHVNCNGGSDGEIWVLTQNPNLPLSYSLNGGPFQGSNSFPGLEAGTYFAVVLDGTGQLDTLFGLVLNEPGSMNLGFAVQDADCNANNGSITPNISGGVGPYTYSWNTAPPQFSSMAIGLGSGTFSLTVTDSIGCTAVDSAFVDQASGPIVNLGNDTLVCNADSVVLNAGNLGLNFLWSNAGTNQTATISTSGSYWVEVTDLVGCIGRDTIEVTFTTQPILDLVADTVLCDQPIFALDADPMNLYNGANFTWSNGETTPAIVVSVTGTYEVEIEYGQGCITRDTTEIQFSNTPYVELGPSRSICGNTEFKLDADPIGLFADASFVWNTLEVTNQIMVAATDLYHVTVRNECGIATDSINIEIIGRDAKVFVPNAFTPNGDGLNDVFLPMIDDVEGYYLTIYDRWGKSLFESNNPYLGWDGSWNGADMPEGVFVYVLRVRNCYLELYTKVGSITLIR